MKHIGHSLLIFVWNVAQQRRQDSKFKEWLQSIVSSATTNNTTIPKISILMIGTHEDVAGKQNIVDRKWVEMIKYCSRITEELGGQLLTASSTTAAKKVAISNATDNKSNVGFQVEIIGTIGMSYESHTLFASYRNKIIFKQYNINNSSGIIQRNQEIILKENNQINWGFEFLSLILKLASHQIKEHDKHGFNGKIPTNYSQILFKMQHVGQSVQLFSSIEQLVASKIDKETLQRSLEYLHSIGVIYYLPNFNLISCKLYLFIFT